MTSHRHLVLAAILGSLLWPCATEAQSIWPSSTSSKSEFASLPRVSSIEGVVVDEQGAPLPRVRVRALGPASIVNSTDTNGFFRLSSLPAGRYVVRAYAAGFAPAMSGRIDIVEGVTPSLRLTLLRESKPVEQTETIKRPVELAAGVGLAAESSQPAEVSAPTETTEASAIDPASEEEDAVETAWRMRHLKRTPLKDVDNAWHGVSGESFTPESTTALQRAVATSAHLAASLFDLSLTGQVNLLTSGTFDSPLELFQSDKFTRNVAYVSLGADAGDAGTWAVRGAMTQGDVSSWILAGFLVAPETRTHAYDIGMSYSTQRYDGGNPAALAAVTDGARNAAEVYGFDRWTVAPRLVMGYGARYSHYDYLTGGGWLSPRISATITPVDRLRVHVLAARRMVAPGAEEFVPSVSGGLWLPPERTFSPLVASDGFRVERSDHYEVGIEHDLRPSFVVAFRAFGQNVKDQLTTLFNVHPTGGASELGHYYVSTAGDVQARGWGASISHELGLIRSTIEYSSIRADWLPSGTVDEIARTAAAVVRDGVDELVDITASLQANVPQTATRLFVLYRLNSGFAREEDDRLGSRFGVQINQSLPFLNFNAARWEMLVDIRNFFRAPASDASAYDELLVFNPPKRIVGGVLVRF
ncbi:MAG TPA: TonB-dependent receptor [Vicinamibacterales bacterium]